MYIVPRKTIIQNEVFLRLFVLFYFGLSSYRFYFLKLSFCGIPSQKTTHYADKDYKRRKHGKVCNIFLFIMVSTPSVCVHTLHSMHSGNYKETESFSFWVSGQILITSLHRTKVHLYLIMKSDMSRNKELWTIRSDSLSFILESVIIVYLHCNFSWKALYTFSNALRIQVIRNAGWAIQIIKNTQNYWVA